MALQNLVGQGLWLPSSMFTGYYDREGIAGEGSALLDADAEEYQIIGDVMTDDGASHVFGNSGSAIEWLPGTVTFNAVSTLRVGIKQASQISAAAGPPIRAATGTGMDVYKDLVAGTDTITTGTALSTAMATLAASAITIAPGDKVCINFYLTKASGTTSLFINQVTTGVGLGYPGMTLITSSATVFTAMTHLNAVMLKFDDGHYGWIFPTIPASVMGDADTGNIGNTNIFGNIIRVPFACKVNGMAAVVQSSSNAANFALDMYSTPLGTPSQMATVAVDANQYQAANRLIVKMFATPQTMAINTDYAFGVRQTTATGVTTRQRDVFATGHWAAIGNGAECYAANSTAAATFAQQLSGRRRYFVWAIVSALDDGVGGGGSGMLYIPDMAGT